MNTKRIVIFSEEEKSAPVFAEKGNLDSCFPTSLSATTSPDIPSPALTRDFWPHSPDVEEGQAAGEPCAVSFFPIQPEAKTPLPHSSSAPENLIGQQKASESPGKVKVHNRDTPRPQIRSTGLSAHVEGIMGQIQTPLSAGMSSEQRGELSNRISEKMKGLPQFQLADIKSRIIRALTAVKSFDEATTALTNLKSRQVLSKRDALTEEDVKRREETVKQETAIRSFENSITHDTQRVMKDSGIADWIIVLDKTARKTIVSDIRATVTKLHNGEIAKLGGAQDPLQPLIDFLKGVKKPEDVRTKLAEFESGNEVFQKVVERAEKSQGLTNDMESVSRTLSMQFRPMIAKRNSQLVKLNSWNAPSLLRFNDGKNPLEAARFEELKKSTGTGFVYIQFGSHPYVAFQMNMKVFSLRTQEQFSLTLKTAVRKVTKSSPVINPQPYQEEEYYTVKLAQTSVEQLQDFGNCLQEGKYELWTVPGDEQRGKYFFALSRELEKPVISLTLTDYAGLSGEEDNYIDMARYLMSGSKETYVPKTVRRIGEANAKLSLERSSSNSLK
jgi:hypothetical protein